MMSEEKLPKVKEMTDHQDVTKYDNKLSKFIETYNQEIKKVKDDTELSNIAFFDIGKELIAVQNEINNDNKAEPKKAKKVFAAFKLRVADKINKNISNVDKVFKVAQFCETDIYKNHEDRLPSGWGTLYLLLSLKNDKKELDTVKIDKLMLDTEITQDIKRADLIKKIDALKNPNKIDKKEVVIKIEGGEEPTQEQLDELQQHLNKTRLFKKQWNVTTPKIKQEESVKDSGIADSKSDEADNDSAPIADSGNKD